jgi:hypothetical protein
MPLDNEAFLKVISNSFCDFLISGTSRSTEKLKVLHGYIAEDIANKLGSSFSIQSQGYKDDKEGVIEGRYIDKKVDITISKGTKAIAGIGLKFVMQNYSQNSNNYFESMLGETANIRCERKPYFQIFIILDKLPYYKKDKGIQKWETFTEHNARKYMILSKDNADSYYHTPNKTLIYIVHIPDNDKLINNKEYLDYYRGMDSNVVLSENRYDEFGDTVIINNYEHFREKLYHTVLAL